LSIAVKGLEAASIQVGSQSGAEEDVNGKKSELANLTLTKFSENKSRKKIKNATRVETKIESADKTSSESIFNNKSEFLSNKQPREESLTNNNKELVSWDVMCVSECPAQLACLVTRVLSPDHNDHALLLCQIVFAIVNNEYWKDGKLFSPILSKYPGLFCYPSVILSRIRKVC
jgi:hypothetical protein